MAPIKLRDGEVTLYARGDSANWYAGFRLIEGGRLQESMKTRNQAEATERALKRYDELKWRAKQGLAQQSVSFSAAADSWLEELEAEVRAGARKPRTVLDYRPAVLRYMNPFFQDKSIDSFRSQDIEKYKVWRRDYWIKGPGKALTHFEFEKRGKPSKRKVPKEFKKGPAPRTINGENVILRRIFGHAVKQGWLTVAQSPSIPNAMTRSADSRKRAYPVFDQKEYRTLLSSMNPWVMNRNVPEKEQWRRQAIYHFIIIMLHSGLREHELFKKDDRSGLVRGLKWSDVIFFTSEKGKQLAELRVEGKTGERTVIVQGPAARWLNVRRRICKNHEPSEFVMAMPDGSRVASFNSGVVGALERAGIRKDPKSGRNRGIYSFRHTYATWRLQAGISPAILSRNMGTGLDMIMHNYYHHHARGVADNITGGTPYDARANLENGGDE